MTSPQQHSGARLFLHQQYVGIYFRYLVVSTSARLLLGTRRLHRIDSVVPNKLSVPLFYIKLIIIYFRRTRYSGAAPYFFTIHIRLTKEELCLQKFLQERTRRNHLQGGPDEIVFKREPEEIFFREDPMKLSSRENPKKSFSGRTRRNFPQGGLEENLFKEEPDKKKREKGKIFEFIYSSFIPVAYSMKSILQGSR